MTIDTAAFLARIEYHGPVAPSATTLRALHLAHLLAVPFENLDIRLGRLIVLDEGRLFDKIVRQRRGGFCYELNGLFAALLRELGFEVTMLAAQFPRADDSPAPEEDHLVLLVRVADSNETLLADVGAGRASFAEPLLTTTTAAQPRPASGASFRLIPEGGPASTAAARTGQGMGTRVSRGVAATGPVRLRAGVPVPSDITRLPFSARAHLHPADPNRPGHAQRAAADHNVQWHPHRAGTPGRSGVPGDATHRFRH